MQYIYKRILQTNPKPRQSFLRKQPCKLSDEQVFWCMIFLCSFKNFSLIGHPQHNDFQYIQNQYKDHIQTQLCLKQDRPPNSSLFQFVDNLKLTSDYKCPLQNINKMLIHIYFKKLISLSHKSSHLQQYSTTIPNHQRQLQSSYSFTDLSISLVIQIIIMNKSTASVEKQTEQEPASYQFLNTQYISSNFTYKCNKIVKQLSSHDEPFKYPEYLITKICKLYHLNQFQLVFFSQILTTQPCLELNSEIFYKSSKKIEGITNPLGRPLFLYLMVIGYAVKSYLNDNTGVYDAKSREIVPDFQAVFQYWAKRYAHEALRTNPKKLNAFYTEVIKSDDHEDQNFKNYNEIVQDLRRLAPQLSDDQSDQQEGQKVEIGSKIEQN